MLNPLLQGFNVAVTRPVDQAQSLCEAIEHHGGNVISFPLIAVSALQDYGIFDQQISRLEATDWAIFISSNAVDFAMPRVLKKYGNIPENLKFAAIGHQTAKALSLFGIHEVLTPHTRFDSETLLALTEMQDVAGKTIAIFRGLGGRELLAETLKARGAKVYFAESYQRINPQKNTDLLDSQWQQKKLDAIIVTSSEAMRYLLQMAGNAAWLNDVVLCVNHERIAELPKQQDLKIAVAHTPNNEAIIACLVQYVQNHGR